MHVPVRLPYRIVWGTFHKILVQCVDKGKDTGK